MGQEDREAYRLRRFRVAVVAVLAIPWAITIPLALLSGSGIALSTLSASLLIDFLLGWAAWQRPGGFATWWIVVGQFVTAYCLFRFGDDGFTTAIGAVEGLAGVLLLVLLVVMRGEIGGRRAEENEVLDSMEALTRGEARQMLRERAQAERRMRRYGYSDSSEEQSATDADLDRH